MKKCFILFFTFSIVYFAKAQTFKYGELYYKRTNSTTYRVEVAQQAFYNDVETLVDVVIPNSVMYNDTRYYVTSMSSDAFDNCIYLRSITIPENISKFSHYSPFDGCTSLSVVNWNAKQCYDFIYDTYSRYPFTVCANTITEINLGNQVRILPNHFCYNMKNIKNIILPESLECFYESAFSGCSSLTSITVPNLVREIPRYGFYGCTCAKKVTIGKGVTSIREYAFDGCDSVTTVEWNAVSCLSFPYMYLDYNPLPENVRYLIFGTDVKELPSYLNYYNTNQIEITLKSLTPPIFDSTNSFNNSKVKVCYIPCGTMEAYQASDWSMFPLVEKGEINIRVESDNELQGSVNIE